MKILLQEKKINLINSIMTATSQQEVVSIINTMVLSLQQADNKDELLTPFVEDLYNELKTFNPYTETAQEWSNIKMARIVINRLKYHWNTAVC